MFLAYWKAKAVVALIMSAWAGGLAMGGAMWAGDESVHYLPPAQTTTPTDSRVQDLLDEHDCWRHEAPPDMENELPGHVVVTTRAGRTVYGGARMVGRAIDQAFASKPAGLTIWGFCR